MNNLLQELKPYCQAAHRAKRQDDAFVYEEFSFRKMTMVLYLIDP